MRLDLALIILLIATTAVTGLWYAIESVAKKLRDLREENRALRNVIDSHKWETDVEEAGKVVYR